MAKKTYRAYGTVLSLSVLVDGHSVRVSFSPVSNYEAGRRGCMYETDDERIQQALEARADYGKRFVQVNNDDWREVQPEEKTEKEEDAGAEAQQLREVAVNGLEDAKVWLVENCEWKPTARPSKASVMKAAETFGIRFTGL